jgi:hypothetical protein
MLKQDTSLRHSVSPAQKLGILFLSFMRIKGDKKESLLPTLTCKSLVSSSNITQKDPSREIPWPLWKCKVELPVCRNSWRFYYLVDKRFKVNSPISEKVRYFPLLTLHSFACLFLRAVVKENNQLQEVQRQVEAEIPHLWHPRRIRMAHMCLDRMHGERCLLSLTLPPLRSVFIVSHRTFHSF